MPTPYASPYWHRALKEHLELAVSPSCSHGPKIAAAPLPCEGASGSRHRGCVSTGAAACGVPSTGLADGKPHPGTLAPCFLWHPSCLRCCSSSRPSPPHAARLQAERSCCQSPCFQGFARHYRLKSSDPDDTESFLVSRISFVLAARGKGEYRVCVKGSGWAAGHGQRGAGVGTSRSVMSMARTAPAAQEGSIRQQQDAGTAAAAPKC